MLGKLSLTAHVEITGVIRDLSSSMASTMRRRNGRWEASREPGALARFRLQRFECPTDICFAPAQGVQEPRIVCCAHAQIRMLVPRITGKIEENVDCPPHQGLGLRQAVGRLK